MYKDKAKQREANRQASRRARIKHRVKTDLTPLAQGMTNEGMTLQGMTHIEDRPKVKPESKCGKEHSMECDPKILAEFREGKTSAKRGKDIKCFEDLPPKAQECINKMSIKDGKIDQIIKADWMASVNIFQRLYPYRYESLINNILV